MQRWVHEQGWTTLHDAQERAIGPILDEQIDVIISAATAAGKTEAAFLPICSALAHQRDAATAAPPADPWDRHDPWKPPAAPPAPGIEVLYVSPLKALINDQYERLELICDRADVPVHRWHGDVSGSEKRKTVKHPSGVLLITPESLEAQFVNRGHEITTLFAGLRYVVIDELHSFLSTPRGAQLQSLLNRVELAIRRRPPRIGLSATLGDMSAAQAFLRPTAPAAVLVIESASDGQELKLQLRGYRRAAPELRGRALRAAEAAGDRIEIEQTVSGDRLDIAEHLFRTLRGRDNLVFANARQDVEIYADLLARRSARANVPNEFWPHHGSLAKDVREVVEAQLKDRTRPVTAVCTSTLEMGIDIGSVASVAQVSPPPSVASLRQRLGRAGRRGEPAVLRLYVTEDDIDIRSAVADELRCGLVQAVAMVRLLLAKWLEPSDAAGLNLSTLIQQVLSVIAQHGGATAAELHQVLCGPGPFAAADPARFGRLLRAMAAEDLIVQAGDGTLLHGQIGERAVNHYSFYSAFQTPEEWRLVADGRPLGTLPITQPLAVDGLLIFAGRRWRITGVDTTGHVVELTRAAGGVPPNFGGEAALVGDRVREEMVAVYQGDDVPVWLDAEAKTLLAEGRAAWRRLALDDHALVAAGNDTVIVPWVGDRGLATAALVLRAQGLDVSVDGPTLTVTQASPDEVVDAARTILSGPEPDRLEIARLVLNTEVDKWDWVLDPELAAEATAARLIDVAGAWRILAAVDAKPHPMHDLPRGETAPDPTPASPTPTPSAPGSLLGHLLGTGERLAVLDVETTGLFDKDRVVEIAIITIDANGNVVDVFETLVNPGRDIGPTWLHQITAEMVVDAPAFYDVAHHVAARLDGAIVVGHNLPFDQRMISNELAGAGIFIQWGNGLDTLQITGCKLGVACAEHGVALDGTAHSARVDAQATADLLIAIAEAFSQPGTPASARPIEVRPLRIHTRSGTGHAFEPAPYLAALAEGLHVAPEVAPYVELLDRALADLKLTEDERAQLAAVAADLGLDEERVARAHREFMTSLIDAALDDHVVTEDEYDQLCRAAALLGVDAAVVAQRTDGHRSAMSDLTLTAGMRVCFTGAAVDGNGREVPRADLEATARSWGLAPTKNVSAKACDLLVAADPASRSGKAGKARQFGIPIASVADFMTAAGPGSTLAVHRLTSAGVALVCNRCGASWLAARASSRPVCADCRSATG
jgi:ATP-dependent Lhr-like helicase